MKKTSGRKVKYNHQFIAKVSIPNDAIAFIDEIQSMKSNKLIVENKVQISDFYLWNDANFCKNVLFSNSNGYQYIKILYGEDFNVLFRDYVFSVLLNKDLVDDDGHIYKDGLNEDTNMSVIDSKGGFNFCFVNVTTYKTKGHHHFIAKVSIPNDAIVLMNGLKQPFKSNKLIVNRTNDILEHLINAVHTKTGFRMISENIQYSSQFNI